MLRFISAYLRPYRKESLLGPLFKLLEAGMELCVPLVIASLIDRGIGQSDPSFIVRMCLLLAAFGTVGLLFAVTAQYFAAKASVGFAKQIRRALFSHIQKMSYKNLDNAGTATLLTRMTSDVQQIQTGVNLTLRLLLRSPFVVFGALIMAFTIDVPAALWFAAAIPLLAIVIFSIMLVSIPLYRKVQEKLDSVLGSVRENLTGVRVLRAFRREKAETESFETKNGELTSRQRSVGRITALLNPLTYILINLAIVFLIHTGAVRVEAGILTQGTVVALYNYMSQILVELIKLADLILQITKALASTKRVKGVLDTPATDRKETEQGADPSGHEPDLLPKSPYRVTFDHVGMTYHTGSEPSLKDLTLSVRPGETIGIIGGTGSGKTTLVNLIPRFYEATEGTVSVNGKDVSDWDVSALRARVGVVPQKAVLFRGTIRDNLLWGNGEATDEELLEAVSIAQASDILEGKNGLDTRVEQSGRNFSGGQKQRLTIARALVRKPDILIFDDSSSALDYATDARLRNALKELDYQPSIFLVSQRTASVMHADKIVVLEEGNVVGIGTHAELLNTCPVYKEIHESQFRKKDAS
ncbi:MAG: ABC transporter ATP-binding protein [Clostridia bacterium]|nr:ABC transporter ATP-binding protein [Clostridia bacterium]